LAQFHKTLRQPPPAFPRLTKRRHWKQLVTHRSDKALIKRILAGDHEACVELIAQYHAPIYRLLGHLCRDTHLAEDLTQETFLAAWAKIGTFNAASSLNTWLHTIAYRKFIDAHRRRERSVPTHSDASIDRAQSNHPSPYERALANEASRRLYRALDHLKSAERDVVVLHYLQGLSYEEVAGVLAEPTGTVKWRTREAIDRLRAALEVKSET
jgi:RNA polymerase sigma-70 factor (ECF subfamily)